MKISACCVEWCHVCCCSEDEGEHQPMIPPPSLPEERAPYVPFDENAWRQSIAAWDAESWDERKKDVRWSAEVRRASQSFGLSSSSNAPEEIDPLDRLSGGEKMEFDPYSRFVSSSPERKHQTEEFASRNKIIEEESLARDRLARQMFLEEQDLLSEVIFSRR